MSVKRSILAAALVFTSIASTQILAASDLTITNNSNQDSTSIINGGLCSTVFGSDGVTKAHTTHVVSSKLITLACVGHFSDCKADIYMTNNCSGPKIATAEFDINQGVKSVVMNSTSYKITGTGFTITIA